MAADPAVKGRQRVQKILAAAGIGSRRHCEELIQEGRVTVNGEVVTDLGTTADPERDEIRFDGEIVRQEEKAYWWLNKPAGVLCTSHDPEGRRTIYDFVPNLGRRVYSVGRLDEASTGLILLTNDGDMAYRLTHPKFEVPKTYEVLVAGKVTVETLQKLRRGLWFAEGKFRAKEIHMSPTPGKATRLTMVLAEGHNREIRRMLARVGHKVMRLQRVAIGPIKIRKLSVGQTRPANEDELQMLRDLATGRFAREPAKSADSDEMKGRPPRKGPPRGSDNRRSESRGSRRPRRR